jgi:6-pyruvoyl-tetrahydropterin synthase
MKLFVQQLTVLDFSFLHPRRGLVGESWWLDIVLEGGLDEQGMVLDFGDVKRQVKSLVDEHFDHRLLVPADHPALSTGDDEVRFCTEGGGLVRHQGPAESVQFVTGEAVTEETVADAIRALLAPHLPGNVERVRLRLHGEEIDGAWYCYSHGLKGHCGNCQRIAHGHRSRIEILRDGRRAPDLEAFWAKRFRDIYIGTEADLAAITRHDDRTHFRFAYEAEQGRFELELPAERCYLIDTESTVENIARHIRERLEREHPGSRFQVRAFEGIGKGAISESQS